MHHSLAALLVSGAAVLAQNYYVPDPAAATGICNSIPLSQSSSIYQTIVAAGDLGGLTGVISGLGFAACGTGTHHYDSLQVILDHTTATTLSTNFAQNLSPAAQVVLDVTDYDWQTTTDTWSELGLQSPFVYNGTDSLVVQLLLTGHTFAGTGSSSFHRDTRQRVYSNGWTGSPPPAGSSSSAALKMEVGVLTARTSQYGRGCTGSNGLPPDASYTGVPQPGQTNQFDLADAPPIAAAFLVTGFGNGAPFPVDLAANGLPGCKIYFGVAATQLAVSDGAGGAAIAYSIPNAAGLVGVLFYGQWACLDPTANPGGLTTSDYVRVHVGI